VQMNESFSLEYEPPEVAHEPVMVRAECHDQGGVVSRLLAWTRQKS